MEKVFSAYTDEHIKSYTERVEKEGLREHGFPRLTANLGILIAHGRKTEYKEQFLKMMDLCCLEIPIALKKSREAKKALSHHMQLGNDFSVKEIVYCLLEIEKSDIFNKEITNRWRTELSKIDPYKTYNTIASVPPERIHNWAAFSATSEQLRKYAGLGNESDFIDNQIASQLLSFDENGMYRDPDEPIVYDYVPRLQLAIALFFGYNGKYLFELTEQLLKSADFTLNMQSVTGEIPFGGRSGQFLHNETAYAAFCEFYASFFAKRGNLKKAGEFKSAARLALENTIGWLNETPIRHVKNLYPNDSGIGCEEYAYFDKYMITAASWLYFAHAMANDEIAEVDCPAISKNYICETSVHFHKVFCKFGDYFLEFEKKADLNYDASSLGRIHKKGAPSAICLSTPFSQNPNFKIDATNPSYFSICAGIKSGEEYIYTYDTQTKYTLTDKLLTDRALSVKFDCETKCGVISQICTITDKGVEITASGDGELEILFPLFDFDGLTKTKTSFNEKSASVIYKGYKCTYDSDGKIIYKNSLYANRNGLYKAFAARGTNNITLKINITKI